MKKLDNGIRCEIAAAGAADHKELSEVWERSVRATHHFLSEADISFFRPLILNGYLKNLRLCCVRTESRIAGFVGIEGTTIEMLFVDPEFMGRGIGRSLLGHAASGINLNYKKIINRYSQLYFSDTKTNIKAIITFDLKITKSCDLLIDDN